MTALIRSQLLGLRALRSTYGAVASMLALVAVIVGADLATNAGTNYTTPLELQEPLMIGTGLLVTVGLALLAAARVSGDYRDRTITNRLLASPRRPRLLAASLLTYASLAVLVGTVAWVIGLAIAQPLTAAKGLSLDLSAGLVLGAVLANVLFALIGVSVGVICRNQAAAVLILVGTFVAEKLLSLVLGSAAAYLPYGLLTPLLGLEGATISRAAAAIALTGISAVLILAASVALVRRDVT